MRPARSNADQANTRRPVREPEIYRASVGTYVFGDMPTSQGRRTPHAAVPDRHVPGEPGLWVFIFGDLSVFAVVFAVYLWYRMHEPGIFAASQQQLEPAYGAAYTMLLLTSSLLVAQGVYAHRSYAATGIARRCLLGGQLCGMAFVVLKIVEYHSKIADGLTITANSFYLCYYIVTGLHLFHVILGIGVLTFLLNLAGKAPTLRREAYIEGGASFWHMVDLLWLIIFPLIYLAR